MADLKENTEGSIKNKEVGIYDYIRVLVKNKKLFLPGTFIVGLFVTFLMFFVIEPIYQSTTTVKSAGSGFGLGSLLGVSGLPDLGGLEELSGGGSTKELALYEEIIMSRRCIEETIIRFNLIDVYKVDSMQDAVKNFRLNIITLESNKKAGTLTIGIFDKDKQKAKDIADFIIFQLNRIYSEMNALNARNNKEFIQQRYDSARQDLKAIEDSLENFQVKFGISPEIQAEVVSRASFGLEVSIKSEEVKLELLKKILTPEQPEIMEQEERISILKKQFDEMRNSNDGSGDFQLKGLPTVLINFYRLKREIEIQNRIVTTLIPIYEQTKFEEKRETPTVVILDYPNLPEKKAKPKRLTTVAISMFAFFIFFSFVIIFYQLYYKRIIGFLRNG
ncbi:MAG: hypothetical protein IPM38_14180 [Ignavibacteria bacterium]|nr:hypothetical protein [Ignavibacteria bacterium]